MYAAASATLVPTETQQGFSWRSEIRRLLVICLGSGSREVAFGHDAQRWLVEHGTRSPSIEKRLGHHLKAVQLGNDRERVKVQMSKGCA